MGRDRGSGVSEAGGLGSVVTEVVVLDLRDPMDWGLLQTFKRWQPIFKR